MGWADAPVVENKQPAWMSAPEANDGAGSSQKPQKGIMARIRDAVFVPENQRDPTLGDAVTNGITGIPEEIGKQFGSAVSDLGSRLKPPNLGDAGQFAADPAGYVLGKVLPAGGDVVSAGMAPITGTATSAVGRPIEQATGINRNITGNALSMAVPFAGDAKAGEEAMAAIKPMAAEAHAAGYVLPPKMISAKPGIFANLLSGVSGKIKTAQAAAEKNQGVTNSLAAQELGLPPDTQLSDQVFQTIRDQAGTSYDAVKAAVPEIKADDNYLGAIQSLGGANSDAALHFPNTMKNQGVSDLVDELSSVKNFPTSAGIELVKELRSSATTNLKAIGDRSKHMLGLAQRQAANAVDDLIQRNVEQSGGDPSLVDAYKQARQLIAKSYDVEGATNTATGDVNALGLAKLASKGKPLTGGLQTIAKVAQAFPSAMKAGVVSEPVSALDFFGAAALAAHGNPKMAGMILARPLSRATILSKPAQRALVGDKGTVVVPPNALRAAPAINALSQLSHEVQQ